MGKPFIFANSVGDLDGMQGALDELIELGFKVPADIYEVINDAEYKARIKELFPRFAEPGGVSSSLQVASPYGDGLLLDVAALENERYDPIVVEVAKALMSKRGLAEKVCTLGDRLLHQGEVVLQNRDKPDDTYTWPFIAYMK